MEKEELSKRDRKKQNREEKKQTETQKPVFQKFGVVALIIAVAAGAFWLMYRKPSVQSSTEPAAETISLSDVNPNDHVKGAENATVTLIEYGDFQCPACGAYHPIVNQIVDEFKDDVKLVFRHFPLKQIHRNAQIASQAVEAAGKQDKFWEMYDLVYEKQEEWSDVRDPRSLFKQYAGDLGLKADQFDTDMNSQEIVDAVNRDYESGIKAGINATPTFYINGSKVSNPQGLEPFKQLIQTVIDQEKQKTSAMPEATESSSPAPSDNTDITPSL